MRKIQLNGIEIIIPSGAEINETYPTSKPPTKITQLAFLNRFTDDEAIDIDLASFGETRDAALLRRYLQKVNAATHIDLSRPDLLEDLNKLVLLSLLEASRVEQILSLDIQSHELFKE